MKPGVFKSNFGVAMGGTQENSTNFVHNSMKDTILNKYGTCNDINELILFLCDNNKSGFITGQTFIIDGGRSLIDPGSGYPLKISQKC